MFSKSLFSVLALFLLAQAPAFARGGKRLVPPAPQGTQFLAYEAGELSDQAGIVERNSINVVLNNPAFVDKHQYYPLGIIAMFFVPHPYWVRTPSDDNHYISIRYALADQMYQQMVAQARESHGTDLADNVAHYYSHKSLNSLDKHPLYNATMVFQDFAQSVFFCLGADTRAQIVTQDQPTKSTLVQCSKAPLAHAMPYSNAKALIETLHLADDYDLEWRSLRSTSQRVFRNVKESKSPAQISLGGNVLFDALGITNVTAGADGSMLIELRR